MELRKEEVEVIAKATEEAAEKALIELDQLQLTMVGGGIGDVILA